MGVTIGLATGVGLLLVYSSWAFPREVDRQRRTSPLASLPGRAGLRDTSIGTLLALCGGAALLAGLVCPTRTERFPYIRAVV